MPATNYYLGHAANGDPVTRKSNRADFTHAAVHADLAARARANALPSFGTSADGARRNFGTYAECEVVPVRIVTFREYSAAQAGGRVQGKGRR
jgi:hypothetical protein